MYAGRVVEELRGRRARPGRRIPIRAACSPRCRASTDAAADCRCSSAIRPGADDERAPMIEVANLSVRFGRDAPRGRRRRVASRSPTARRFGLVGESRLAASPPCCARIAGLDPDWAGEIRLDGAAARARAARPRLLPRACRWCSRTPTARCIRARPSTACCWSRCASTASATADAASTAALDAVGLGRALPLPLSAPAFRRPAPARRHRPRPDPASRTSCCSTSRPRRSTCRCRPRS